MKRLSQESLWTAADLGRLEGLERLAKFLGLTLPAPNDPAYKFKLIRSIQREEKRIQSLPKQHRWDR